MDARIVILGSRDPQHRRADRGDGAPVGSRIRRGKPVEIANWLSTLGLGQYEQAFHENAIDAEVLADITDADLVALGYKFWVIARSS